MLIVSAGTALAARLVPYAGTTSQQAAAAKPAIKFSYGLSTISGFTYTAVATCTKPGSAGRGSSAPVAGRIDKLKVTGGRFATPPPSPAARPLSNAKTVSVAGTVTAGKVAGTLSVSYFSGSSPAAGLSCSTGKVTFTALPAPPAKKHKGHRG